MTIRDEDQNIQDEITCPACRSHFFLARLPDKQVPRYCPFCSHSLHKGSLSSEKTPSRSSLSALSEDSDIAYIEQQIPQEKIQFTIGPYHVLEAIGKGGMGEVFLAYDTICGRKIALKRIRADLIEHRQLFHRFLKEARITSQLTHPSIIPIYAIHEDQSLIYYTMPYVEGETLKEVLKRTRQQEKRGEKLNHLGGSIPALIRVLINICQAVAYAHSKGILHRDLKPENIILGRFGEVLILDWGLAKVYVPQEIPKGVAGRDDDEDRPSKPGLTIFGKVVGTVAFMAPERALGNPATPLTDIYALGVILYQMLTLHIPFRRTTITEFRKSMHMEQLSDPAEVAPYRDVPKILARICQQCLAARPEERYQTVEDLIRDLENYIEGRSEWFQTAQLDIRNKRDWEFQENVLIAEHVAITRNADISDWVSLMISKLSFSENIKIEAKVFIGDKGHGLGFLLSIPEGGERSHLNDGYCLWVGSDQHKATKLLRSTVEVLTAPDTFLQRLVWHRIRIEKVENNIHFYLDDVLQFSYISHLPMSGTHIGLLSRDADFDIRDFTVAVGSQSVMVKCLAVPDAFLSHKDYAKALTEYRRIGYSFPGRAEGREAMFRAGVTLLEQARNCPNPQEAKDHYELALQEFEKLHGTPGAPLEYLGKALVYESLHDYGEEIKCYTLACRRHKQHPLLHVLEEQIVYRMHESSRQHRLTTYQLVLLVVRHLPAIAASNHSQKLFASLQKHWEPLPFILEDPACADSKELNNLFFAIQLSFWLAKPYFLGEILDELNAMPSFYPITAANALFCMIELGSWQFAEKKWKDILEAHPELEKELEPIGVLITCCKQSLAEAVHALFNQPKASLTPSEMRTAFFLARYALDTAQMSLFNQITESLLKTATNPEVHLRIDYEQIWADLLKKDWAAAGKILMSYPPEMVSKDSSPLHFLYGCWLLATQGEDAAHRHFSAVLEVSYPRSTTLATHFLNGRMTKDQRWYQKAFVWEKRQLYRELSLYFYCLGDQAKAAEYQRLEKLEYVAVSEE